MGIYVQSVATIPPVRSAENLAQIISSSAKRWAARRGLESFFYSGVGDETGVSISFYPPAEIVRFEVSDGRISFGVKTSMTGPGYHKRLIDLCDWLQLDLDIKWRWDVGGDETGYALQRDATELEQAYVDQFSGLCEFVKENEGTADGLKVNLPIDLAFDEDNGVATPVGPLPAEFFVQALEAQEEITEYAARFMPWWEDRIEGRFWADTLRTLLWTEAEWRPSRTLWEAHVHRVAIVCYEHLRLAERVEFQAAVTELRTLSASEEGSLRPLPKGIGWKRRLRAFLLPGSWRVNLPGYYVETAENDGGTICLWFGSEAIRGSSYSLKTLKPKAIEWSGKYQGSSERRSRSGDPVLYRVANSLDLVKDSSDFLIGLAEFHGIRQIGEYNLLMLSVCDSRDDLLKRVEEVAASVWLESRQAPVPALL